jgi:23S rRNA (pseudouridine1915-N3)-methyltransferase
MFKVKIITIGKLKETWLQEAVAEYTNRLKSTTSIEWVLLKDDKELEKSLIKEKKYICLVIKGKEFSSEEFHNALFHYWEKISNEIVIVIGGSEGLSSSILSKAYAQWSLSKMTFTHQITRIILLEQIYRAQEIEKNSPYHK